MKIMLHGTLAERFGAEHHIETVVPAEAIEGLSRQFADWPRDLLIDAPGFDTEEALYAQTTEREIHLLPRIYGGGGKWGSILIGGALIALAIATGPAGLSVLGMTIAQSSLFLMGAGLVLSGVSQMFMQAPTIDKPADPPPSKYFGVNQTTIEVGTTIGWGYGRMRLSGHWLSIQANSSAMVSTTFPGTTS